MKLLPFEYATRNLGRSPVRLLLTVFGSGLVVLLIMIAGSFMVGMQATLDVSGSNNNIMLLGAGSVESVERSEVGMDTAGIVAGSIDGFRSRAGVEGISSEIHIQMPILVDGEDRLVLIRGIRPEAFLVHDQVNIVSGHAPRNGRNELLVGKLAAQTLGTIRFMDDKGDSYPFSIEGSHGLETLKYVVVAGNVVDINESGLFVVDASKVWVGGKPSYGDERRGSGG